MAPTSGGATTLIFIADGADAVSSFVMRSKPSWYIFLWHTGLDDHGWYAEDRDVGYTAEQRPRRRLDRVRRQGKKKR